MEINDLWRRKQNSKQQLIECTQFNILDRLQMRGFITHGGRRVLEGLHTVTETQIRLLRFVGIMKTIACVKASCQHLVVQQRCRDDYFKKIIGCSIVLWSSNRERGCSHGSFKVIRST